MYIILALGLHGLFSSCIPINISCTLLWTPLTQITSSYMYPLNVTNSVAQEPEGSSLHSQQLATGPYSEPTESNPQPPPPSQSPEDPFRSHPPIYALVFRVISFLWAFSPKPFTLFSLMRATFPAHLICLD
jgi:hypothetical protein